MRTAVRSSADPEGSVDYCSGLPGGKLTELFQVSLALGTYTDKVSFQYPPKSPISLIFALLLPMAVATFLYIPCCNTAVLANLLPKPEIALTQPLKGHKLFHLPLHILGFALLQCDPQNQSLLSFCYCHCFVLLMLLENLCPHYAALLSGECGIHPAATNCFTRFLLPCSVRRWAQETAQWSSCCAQLSTSWCCLSGAGKRAGLKKSSPISQKSLWVLSLEK